MVDSPKSYSMENPKNHENRMNAFFFPPRRRIFLHCASPWSNGSSEGKHRLANSPLYWCIQYDPAVLTLHLSQPVGQCCGIHHRNHAGNMVTAITLLHTVQPLNTLP